jgi:hypothetical protein
MINTSIAGTTSNGHRDVIGLPCLPAASQISKEKEVTGIIADNQIIVLIFQTNRRLDIYK